MIQTIPILNRAGAIVAHALVDEVDVHLAQYTWVRTSGNYAVRFERSNGRRFMISMVRQILNPLTGMEVDHVNGDTLDNRRSNLRPATRAENMRNRRRHRNNHSGFKGVDLIRRVNRWRASILANGRRVHLGCYTTAEEAAMAYDRAAIQFFGKFAALNFPVGVK